MSDKYVTVLLDTMVVAGLFSVTRNRNDKVLNNIKTWEELIEKAVAPISGEHQFIVPTPVCYELMSWNKDWKDFVLEGNNPIFKYATYSISAKILQEAAKYSSESEVSYYDEKKHKIKGMDPIIAAYCLQQGHYLLTENHKDFPDSHFEVVSVSIGIFLQKKGKIRKIIFLLKPKLT